MNKLGGKAIASGGFGCVFYPALRCKNEKERNKRNISKLMTNKHALSEFEHIEKFEKILSTVKNNQNYYMLHDFYLCEPAPLTSEDMVNYTKECKHLKKKSITHETVNDSLNKLTSLNMPNGGIDVDMFVNKNFTASKMVMLNNSLIELLVNGIVPMNNLNVYHCDVKDTNILVSVENGKCMTRIIDWGLSVHHTHSGMVSLNLYKRPFQFNVPFSVILFNNDLFDKYTDFLELNPNPPFYLIREFVINYIFYWNDERGLGHLKSINRRMEYFTIHNMKDIHSKKVQKLLIEYEFTYYYMVEYISKVLDKYTKNGELDLQHYFNTLFLKTIDIWGFITIYFAIYDMLYDKLYEDMQPLNKYEILLMEKIKYIVIHFLYDNPLTSIDINELTNELKGLNIYLEKIEPQSILYLNDTSTKTFTQNRGGRGRSKGKGRSRRRKTLKMKRH